MNKSQENAVNRIKAALVSRDTQEFKHFELSTNEYGWVIVNTVVGDKGDEGTALAFCRVSRLFFVGPRGAIELHFFSNSSCVKSGTPLAKGNKALHYYEVK